MIKRTETNSKARRKNSTEKRKAERLRRRRLMMEGLEDRQLLNAAGGTPPAAAVVPTQFDGPRNIGTVPSFTILENEAAGDSGFNDSLESADFIPLGTGLGEEDTIDITGSMGLTFNAGNQLQTDVDIYEMNLRAGDILDISIIGAGANYTVLYGDPDPRGRDFDPRYRRGMVWFGTDTNTAVVDPTDPLSPSQYGATSPLQTIGNAVGAQVVPRDGTYFLYLAPSTTTSNYIAGLRVYRPVAESLPIGESQIIYLDFDGGVYPTSVFDAAGTTVPQGVVRILSLEENLALLGFTNPLLPSDINRVIDFTVEETIQELATLGINGTNGDFASTGEPGSFGVTVLNSRDHLDPGLNNPRVTRVFIGSELDLGLSGLFGVSQSIDVGNFDMGEIVLAALEPHVSIPLQFPLSPSATAIDAISQQMAATITHELGHSFGIWHTDGNNNVDNLLDEGSASLVIYSQGVGLDGIFGTSDDIVPMYNDDRFSITEQLFFGIERVPAALSHVLSTGTIGGFVNGRVFNDFNRDGSSLNDDPLEGVTVYLDLNGNGVQDPSDPVDTTNANGEYSLLARGGTFNVYVIDPDQFIPTTPNPISVTVGSGGATVGHDFGFVQVIPDITGTKFSDNNGNGLFDSTESGIEGVYIYIDLDNDDRPDLGEPATFTESDGTYNLNFPGPGTYTIREVVEPGFIQTFPSTVNNGEHIVTFNGIALTDNFNFGNLPSRDFGDAPDSFSTTTAAGGPSHGITLGLGLGAEVDRELDGQPSVNADGDDNDLTLNDEDGVRQLTPLGPGADTTFRFDIRNDSGTTAYLQGWIDFNADGDFLDAGEQVIVDRLLSGGTHDIDISVPDDVVLGTTYARFRYSTRLGLGVGGEADDGEVEDYVFNVQDVAEILNNDNFTVSRNSQSNQFFVLANDFETPLNPLTIAQLGLDGTDGQVTISADGRSIFYTPRNNFVGLDAFLYSVRDASGNIVQDEFGNPVTATVSVNVTFQSAVPIAVDDTFEIPQGSSNRALNVLDNDVPSVAGGIQITSVTGGDQGGRVIIDGGGQTLRYTPAPGFSGTEQFMYSIQDQAGQTSFAEVTVNMLPGSRLDDLAEFDIRIFDTVNNREITNVQVGQQFNVRVLVDDLRFDEFNRPVFNDQEGLASAFLDLLYTDELVATIDTDANPNFPFDITFGPLFEDSGFASGSSAIPGLLDEVGAVQPIPISGQLMEHEGFTELFTVTMEAVSPGVAIFTGDPADLAQSETILLGENTALTPAQIRLGRTELTISPSSVDFPSAIDDSFPDGLDSDGNAISSLGGGANRLDVLANDNLGPTGRIREFGLATAPTLGTVEINNNGTPTNFNDDFLDYTPFLNANGFDRFTYVIVTDDDIRSTAEVTMQVGSPQLQDDIVAIDFNVVDEFGNQKPIVTDSNGDPAFSVNAGERFGVQVIVEDLRAILEGQTFVFAGYLDMLYERGLISVSDTVVGDRYNFDVAFEPEFDSNSGVGNADRLGLIDEFGTLLRQASTSTGIPARNLMATVFFVAAPVTQSVSTQIVGGPADSLPFQDTLLFDRDEPVPVSQIRYDDINIEIRPGLTAATNTALPEDVNANGVVTPSDALAVINTIDRNNRGALGEYTGNVPVVYADVSADGNVTVVDALRVVNFLNEQAAQLRAAGAGEGELVTRPEASPIDRDADELFAEINGQKDQSFVVGSKAQAAAAVSLSALEDDSEDDEDDVLSILADDVLGQRL